MMKSIYILLFALSFVIPGHLYAQVDSDSVSQEPKARKTSLSGYLKFLQTVQFEKVDERWTTDNVFHNRLNFKWYLMPSLTFTAEARTRLFYGETVRSFPQYADIIDSDEGYLADLSGMISKGDSYFLHSGIDRLNLDWQSEKWQVRLGRQRINWGQTFVWNPNDIFNAYSFFDFDYEERPGSDAALVRYYTGATSSIEFATAFARDWDDYKIAAMYRWNRVAYDYQVLTGKVGTDYAIGAGWSGQIRDAGFKGEFTWLEPLDDFFSGDGGLVASLSLDYTFESSLFLHTEAIYNSFGGDANLSGISLDFLTESRSPKTLTFTDWSWFNEASYQVTPLLKAGLYSMYNPADGSVFLGPNMELSVSDNVYLLFLGQFFLGSSKSIYGNLGYFNYLRLKWNF
jgi:hypothetical protein